MSETTTINEQMALYTIKGFVSVALETAADAFNLSWEEIEKTFETLEPDCAPKDLASFVSGVCWMASAANSSTEEGRGVFRGEVDLVIRLQMEMEQENENGKE